MATMTKDADCIVIGAGPAGLAAAHELMRVGRRVLVLEQGPALATSWRQHRAELRLHTVRRLSALPGKAIPRSYGQYVTSQNLVRYFEDYAAESNIDIRFNVPVARVRRLRNTNSDLAWEIVAADGRLFRTTTVVIATGYNRVAHIPDLPGIKDYSGEFLHAANYQGGTQFLGQDVLVVGAGNAASEAATALIAGGAGRVRLAVRTTPHIVRRRVLGVPMQAIAIMFNPLPTRTADKLASLLAQLTVPDLSASSMARPRADLYTRVLRDKSVPVHDTGILRLLQSGTVTAVAAAAGFERELVHLSDGSSVDPDVVMFATGYKRGLTSLLEGLDMTDESGGPRVRSGQAAAPGFYFVGFTVSATGALRQMSADARRVAREEEDRVGSRC